MIYWRLLMLTIFVASVCLLNIPGQITQIEYALSHNRTRMLERQLLVASKNVQLAKATGDNAKYVEAIESLGWVYYQLSNVTDAESTFTKELDFCRAHKREGFDGMYAHSLLNLATYYRERANFPRAVFYFNMLRDYDISDSHIPDVRRARDMANLGLVFYLQGEGLPEADKRAESFITAESFCESALDEYKMLPGSERSQGDVLATQSLVLRDLGLPKRAENSLRKSRKILADAGNKAVEP